MNNASLQLALFDRLNAIVAGDPELTGLAFHADVVQPDFPENDEAFPFCTFGVDATTPFNTKSWVGTSVIASIDIWSRERNFIETKTISDALWANLDNSPLTLRVAATGEAFMMTVVGADFMHDPDGVTKHGNLTVRILTADI